MLDDCTQYKLRNTHHSDEKTRLLRGTTNTSITDDADSEASSKTSETDRQTCTELNETLVQGHLQLNYVAMRDDDGVQANRDTYGLQRSTPTRQARRSGIQSLSYSFVEKTASTHSDDTSHDNWNNTLHHQVRSKDGHGRNADS